jgi:hypothetical protein
VTVEFGPNEVEEEQVFDLSEPELEQAVTTAELPSHIEPPVEHEPALALALPVAVGAHGPTFDFDLG